MSFAVCESFPDSDVVVPRSPVDFRMSVIVPPESVARRDNTEIVQMQLMKRKNETMTDKVILSAFLSF